jgi:hypothetical protein
MNGFGGEITIIIKKGRDASVVVGRNSDLVSAAPEAIRSDR